MLSFVAIFQLTDHAADALCRCHLHVQIVWGKVTMHALKSVFVAAAVE